ncbi:MAG: Hpt domain-containing protein [Nitrosomonas sp.]|nr:Hpt domain-containing protein [Nitrosomonas sp.]
MNTQTKLNIASISGIKESIHEIFSLIEENLDNYSQNLNDEKQLDSSRVYIQQLNGLFKMLELNNITIITGKIEQLVSALIDKKTDPTLESIVVLKQAISALLFYLDELLDGVQENPMRLFPIYRNLKQVLGEKQVSEFDLFYPVLTQDPPLKPILSGKDSQQLEALANRMRAGYQSNLAQWLKNTSSTDNLKKMHDAIGEVAQFPGSIEHRAFWWISAGFLESLLSQNATVELSNRKLCGKIEQVLRHFQEGSQQDTILLQRELLYAIAKTPTETEQITAIRKAYALPTFAELNASELTKPTSPQSDLHEMRSALKQANEDWRAFSSGKHTYLAAFINSMAQVRNHSTHVENAPLRQLAETIEDVAKSLHAHSQEINDRALMEITTALLQLENIIENLNRPQNNLSEQVEAASTRLKATAETDEKPVEQQSASRLDEIENPAQNKKLQTQAVQEIINNLREIEKILEDFFETPAERTALSALPLLFTQTSGALAMLDLQRAKYLLNLCYTLIEKFPAPDYALNQNEQNLLVDGISSLSFFLEAFKNDQAANTKVIESAITVFENASKQKPKSSSTHDTLAIDSDFEETSITETELIAEVEPERRTRTDSGVDPELLSIFLEEAEEILAEVAECIQKCQSDDSDMKSLTTIRRGFHTLKGSGRMVKLEFLSDAAWTMEKTLNHWLNDKKRVSSELIQLMKYAHHVFTEWCGNLKASGETEIQLEEMLDLIDHLSVDAIEEGKSSTLESVAVESRSDASRPPETSISIGGIAIPVELYNIFVTESKQHLATLENELKTLLAAHPARITQPLTLATHTLASTSRALKLDFIADPSSMLEEWLTQLREKNINLKESDTHLIQNCIQHIGEMLHKVYQQQFPEETDLQLVQFLSHEITKHQAEDRKLTTIATHSEPINLTEYRLKKAPAFTALETSPVKTQEKFTGDKLDNISYELLQAFFEEAKDTIPQISAKLRAWRILPQNEDVRISLLRLLHTLKGSANMIGAQQLGELIHAMEEDVDQAFNNPVVSLSSIETVEYKFDQLCERIEQLQTQNIIEKAEEITDFDDISELTEPTITDRTPSVTSGSPNLPEPAIETTLEQTAPTEIRIEEPHHSGNFLRINADHIDRLVNESGEVSIIRTKIETQLNNFKQSLQDLTESVDRLHGQLREIEIQAETQMQSQIASQQNSEQSFDPLELDRFTRFQELTRLMAESVDDVITVQKNLNATHSAAAEAVAQQATINHQLQQELIRIRTVPFGSISERYYRVIRKTANELGKKINLTIRGEDTEIDRSVLEKISASLEHILRNAVAHGIEKPDQRTRSGKPETGQIQMDLYQKGNEVAITIRDDGCGLDLENIRQEATKMNLIRENESLSDDQIAALIFSPGLTTQDHATGTSGRGIGMDIVQNDISGLGGHVAVSSKRNQETVFHIQLPLTLAVTQSFLISSGNQVFAIPTPIVRHAQELDPEALQAAYKDREIIYDENTYPLTYLPFILGKLNQHPETKRHNHILLLHKGDMRLAIHVDELIGNREVIVKNTGPQIMHAPGIEGATVNGEGTPVLILNPLKLLHREDVQRILITPVSDIITQTAQKDESKATILIVDDSLTVRKVTSRLLDREGYKILTAKQGLEAMDIIAEIKPDIILADLEMPKMNGFELIQKIRSNPDTADIPIIVITSRTAEKHRKMATEFGANEFLGKPYKEEDLLSLIVHYAQQKQ